MVIPQPPAPTPTRPPYPMLARVAPANRTLAEFVADGYEIEPKLDGIRCLAIIAADETVQLYNRSLANITPRFPDVVQQLRHVTKGRLATRDCIIDGEIVVISPETGRPDFQLVQHRMHRTRGISTASLDYPAQLGVFDVLRASGQPTTDWYYRTRRLWLEECLRDIVIPRLALPVAQSLETDHRGEGLMLKHHGGLYHAGGRGNGEWLKYKWLREVDCYIGGVTYGIGRRESTFAGLLCGVFLPLDVSGTARLTYIGTVGTGFSHSDLIYLGNKLAALRIPDVENPFAMLGRNWYTMYFTSPILKIRVAFAEYTKGGIMRFPRFVKVIESDGTGGDNA